MLSKKNIFQFIIFCCILCPFLKVEAATNLKASNQTPIVGSVIDINLYIDYGTTAKISQAHYIITYDSSCFQFKELVWSQAKGTYRNENGKLYIDKTTATASWSYGIPVTPKFTVLKACKSEFNIELNGDATFENGSKVSQTTSGVTINSITGDTSTQLNTLYIKNYPLSPTFNKNITSYTVTVPSDVSEVEIVAQKGDSTQTITGAGLKTLNYGDNRARIVVTSQSGTTNTYEIMIHRTDNRNANTSLKNLSVSNTDITFSEDKDTYEATVSKSISSVFITAKTSDSEAQLIGTGTKNLEYGLNTFEIKVKATNGEEKIYKINITRSTEEIQSNIASTKLLSLNVNNTNIILDDKQKNYLLGVDKNITTLEINAVPESKTAKVEITGNESLKSGINIITLKISETTNENNEIKLIVYKEPENANIINGVDQIDSSTLQENNIIYANNSASHLISKEKLSLIKENKKTIYYNVVNEYKGLLYQLKLNANVNPEELDLSFVQTSDTSLTYNTNLPSGIEIMLYLDTTIYEDDTTLKIYTYNENGNYTLLSEGTKKTNGYISFITNGEKNYVVTTQELIREETLFDKIFSLLKPFIIGLVIIIIVILLISFIVKQKIKAKKATEPEY